jgi:ABC-2 type transport system ATP-binding protein
MSTVVAASDVAAKVDVPVLAAIGLSKRYGDLVAVDGLSFQIAPGETYGLVGPNGAGKTTAISMVVGILASDTGTVTVAGQRVSTASRRARNASGTCRRRWRSTRI